MFFSKHRGDIAEDNIKFLQKQVDDLKRDYYALVRRMDQFHDADIHNTVYVENEYPGVTSFGTSLRLKEFAKLVVEHLGLKYRSPSTPKLVRDYGEVQTD